MMMKSDGMNGSVSFDKGVGLAIRCDIAGFNAGGTADFDKSVPEYRLYSGAFFIAGHSQVKAVVQG